MINANEVRNMMPSSRMDTIVEEVEKLILEAATNDKTSCAIPIGFFGPNMEREILYNAKAPPLFVKVKQALHEGGFKLKTKDLQFFISWNNE